MLMKWCNMAKQSWRLALLEYLTTPLDDNTPSPSKLNGSKFNSLLPNVNTLNDNSDILVKCHDTQLQQDTKRNCLSAAKLVIETISLIIMTLVLLQHGTPDRTRFVLSTLHTLAIITLISSIQMHHTNPIQNQVKP